MSIESTVYSRLSSDAELVALVGAIRPTMPEENAPNPPQLVYTVTQSEVTLFSGGASSLKRYAVQLDCYAVDLLTALTVLDRAKAILDGWSSGIVQWCKYETQLSAPTDPGSYAQHVYTLWANQGGNEPVVGEDFAELRACDHVLRLDCDGLTLDGEAVGSGGGSGTITTTTPTDLDGYLYGDGATVGAVTPYDPESFGSIPYWRPGVGWTAISTEEASGSVLVFDTDGNHNWADPAGSVTITSSTATTLTGLLKGDGSTVSAVTTSAQLRATITDETGTGNLVFNDTPTLITPTLTGVVNVSGTGSGTFSGANSTSLHVGVGSASVWSNTDLEAVGKVRAANKAELMEGLNGGQMRLWDNAAGAWHAFSVSSNDFRIINGAGLNVAGGVTAASFSGDGNNITNIDGGAISGAISVTHVTATNTLTTNGNLLVNDQLRTNNGHSSATTLGTVVGKYPIYDNAGTLRGWLPLYDSIT